MSCDDADAESGQVELVLWHRAGVLGRLASEQRAAGPAASLGHALDQLGDLLGHHPPDREVVEEEQRLGADTDDVVDAHRHQIDPDGPATTGQASDLQLRPDPVGSGGQQLAPADIEQSREAPEGVGDLGTPCGRGKLVRSGATALAAASVSTPAAR